MSYGLLVVIGLLTSVHCVAMCGGINLSQCARVQQPSTGSRNRWANLRPRLLLWWVSVSWRSLIAVIRPVSSRSRWCQSPSGIPTGFWQDDHGFVSTQRPLAS